MPQGKLSKVFAMSSDTANAIPSRRSASSTRERSRTIASVVDRTIRKPYWPFCSLGITLLQEIGAPPGGQLLLSRATCPPHPEDTPDLKAEGESGDRPGFGRRFVRPSLHRRAETPSGRGALRVPILPMDSAKSSSDTPSSGFQSSATRGEPKGRAFSPTLGNGIDDPLQELKVYRLRCMRRPRAEFFQHHPIRTPLQAGVFVCLFVTGLFQARFFASPIARCRELRASR